MNDYKLLSLLFLLLIGFTFTACDDDDDPTPEPNTISELASETDDLSTLYNALERTGLDQTFDQSGSFTVFAPSNQAFQEFLNENNFNSLDEIPQALLEKVLRTHVHAAGLSSAELTTGYYSALSSDDFTSNNLFLYVENSGGVTINGEAVVTTADINASNGVIHLVDDVIDIPTVVTYATSNDDFSSLVGALTRSDLTTDYAGILSGTQSAPFTVFAPTNAAFEDLLTLLGLNDLSEIPADILATVLEYHVVAGVNARSGGLSDGQSVQTLQGENLTIELGGGVQIADASGINANVQLADIQANNGVIHVIDKVLLPDAVVSTLDPDLVDMISMDQRFSTLQSALERANLIGALEDENASLTVFAPTNDAFADLLAALGVGSLEDIPVDLLTQTLLNHVVGVKALSTDLSTGYYSTLAAEPSSGNNLSLYADLTSGVLLNGTSNVTEADLEVSNGVIHVVDAVITLPNIATFALADPRFEILTAALTRDDLTTDFVSVLAGQDNAPFTVFAPNNDAFGDLLNELGVQGLGDIDAATLEQVLTYHVVPSANVLASMLTDGQTINTLQGGDLTVDLSGPASLVDENQRESIILQTDIQAYNGVVHVIDKVVLP